MVYLYRLEIGEFGGGGCGGEWLRATEGRHWMRGGLCSTFSQIHHSLVVGEMQSVVCVEDAADRRRAPRFTIQKQRRPAKAGRYNVKT